MVLYCCWIIGKFFTLIHLMWAVCKLVLALCLVEVFRSSNHPPWGSHGVCVTSLTQWRASRGPPILRQLGWRLRINYRWTTHCHLFAAAVFSFQIRLWFVLLLRPSWCAPMIFLRVLRGSSLPSRRPLSLGWARPLSRRWLLWAGWPLHLCPSVQGGHRGGGTSSLGERTSESKGEEAVEVGTSAQPPIIPARLQVPPPTVSESIAEGLPSQTHRYRDDSGNLPLDAIEREIWQQQYNKSVKSDDAQVPVHLWDDRVWVVAHNEDQRSQFEIRFQKCPLSSLRHLLLRVWVRNVSRSLLKFLTDKHGAGWGLLRRADSLELRRDLEAGAECVWRATEADWWEWKAGSRLMFWRWPPSHQESARDGYPPFIRSALPKYLNPQPAEKDQRIRDKVREKLSGVREKRYIAAGNVKSLTSYFGVPKGESDI